MPGEREIAQALLTNYEPSLRDRAGNAIYDIAQALGMGSTANRMRNEGTAVMDFIPGVGEVLGVNDAMNDFNAGNYGMGAAGLGLSALGAVPGVGDVAASATKKALPHVHESAARLFDSLRALGVPVSHPSNSINRHGEYSSYINTPLGEVRISDHSKNPNFDMSAMNIHTAGGDFDAEAQAQYIAERISQLRIEAAERESAKIAATEPFSLAYKAATSMDEKNNVLKEFIESGIAGGPRRWDQVPKSDRSSLRRILEGGD